MAFDAFFLRAVLDEIRQKAIHARIDKIHQPSRDTLILHLRCKEGREKLLFAANPTAPRLHLTTSSPENPPEPPMFCMLLRKHLVGARVADIVQPHLERMVRLELDITDDFGQPGKRTLVLEAMGRRSNLILLDEDLQDMDWHEVVNSVRRMSWIQMPHIFLMTSRHIYPENIS